MTVRAEPSVLNDMFFIIKIRTLCAKSAQLAEPKHDNASDFGKKMGWEGGLVVWLCPLPVCQRF